MASPRKTGTRPLHVLGQRQLGVVVLDAYGRPFVRTYDDLADLFGADKVTGPGSATDNALVRFDGVTGKLVQDGQVLESDDGRLTTLTDPTGAQDAATKAYVDAALGGGGVLGDAYMSPLATGGFGDPTMSELVFAPDGDVVMLPVAF